MRSIGAGCVFVVVLQTACGGSGHSGDAGAGGTGGQPGGGGSCGTVSPCGGDLVGTWTVARSCLVGTKDLSSICASASAEVEYVFSGTVTYNADGTYSSALAATTTAHEHYPSGCAPFGLTCEQLAQVAIDAGVSAACSIDAAGACNCDSVPPATVDNAPGTYRTSGGMLTTTHGSTTTTGSYCVQGGVLHELPAPGDGGLIATGEVVLTKQ